MVTAGQKKVEPSDRACALIKLQLMNRCVDFVERKVKRKYLIRSVTHPVTCECMFQEVKRKYLIRSVTHPVTHEEISIKDAIDKRIVIMERGIYVNPESGSYLTIPEAMQRDLIKVNAPHAPIVHARNNPR